MEAYSYMEAKTQQPSPPYEREGKWFITYYKLAGPVELGPYENEAVAYEAFITALRIHEANGYTDGPVNSVID